jgi:hypothetical protein
VDSYSENVQAAKVKDQHRGKLGLHLALISGQSQDLTTFEAIAKYDNSRSTEQNWNNCGKFP